jgi:hypothetical protein
MPRMIMMTVRMSTTTYHKLHAVAGVVNLHLDVAVVVVQHGNRDDDTS